MIHPGMINPGMGAQRTAQMRQRLREMMQRRAQMPRMGGNAMRPVAGPGVRSFGGGGGSIHPAQLSALVNRLSNAVIPMQAAIPGLPSQSQGASLDTLPDQAVGAPPGFHQRGPGGPIGFDPSLTPAHPIQGNPMGGLPAHPVDLGGLDPGVMGAQPSVGGGGGSDLIPLGGGSYFDPNTGTIHGPLGQNAF